MSDGDSSNLETFHFRDIHPLVCIGTASDRYAGWIGQIYSAERYFGRTTRRTKKVGRKNFVEEVLPVESVEEYFRHFRTLELDFSHFPRTPNIQAVNAFLKNEDYLNAGGFVEQFYEPVRELLDPWLEGVIFEQEYQRKDDRVSIREQADALDGFFSALPLDDRFHVELRTQEYLTKPVIQVLEKHGVGQVLSHWTWLPALNQQFAMGGKRFHNRGRSGVIRLMTPRGMRYEDAYAKAYPFDKLVPGMMNREMITHTAHIMAEALKQGTRINVIVNNRSGGNAPLIAREVAREFLAIN
ncbi:MAG: hypothetical protein B1H13_12570 [Desulfobacteraceae bacterium 4484_190.3]|nr:MAG: hypothetical protein B1H13_12570 [Desulfobacteraceae bacterium 4484_190.3]